MLISSILLPVILYSLPMLTINFVCFSKRKLYKKREKYSINSFVFYTDTRTYQQWVIFFDEHPVSTIILGSDQEPTENYVEGPDKYENI